MNFLFRLFLLVLGVMTIPLVADDLTVTVVCNGQKVGKLPITVYDSQFEQIPNVEQTDNQGQFIIENSQNYMQPFMLFFRAANGSTCGSYTVIVNGDGVGFVGLNYYPTELPCSCSKLTQAY